MILSTLDRVALGRGDPVWHENLDCFARARKDATQQWARWWVIASESWSLQELLNWFIAMCWELEQAAVADGLLRSTTLRCNDSLDVNKVVA